MKNPFKALIGPGVPKMKNPPPPPPVREVQPVGIINPKYKPGGFVPGPGSAPEVKINPVRLSWHFETFSCNTEAQALLNKNRINPKFIYPGSTGRVTIWYQIQIN